MYVLNMTLLWLAILEWYPARHAQRCLLTVGSVTIHGPWFIQMQSGFCFGMLWITTQNDQTCGTMWNIFRQIYWMFKSYNQEWRTHPWTWNIIKRFAKLGPDGTVIWMQPYRSPYHAGLWSSSTPPTAYPECLLTVDISRKLEDLRCRAGKHDEQGTDPKTFQRYAKHRQLRSCSWKVVSLYASRSWWSKSWKSQHETFTVHVSRLETFTMQHFVQFVVAAKTVAISLRVRSLAEVSVHFATQKQAPWHLL